LISKYNSFKNLGADEIVTLISEINLDSFLTMGGITKEEIVNLYVKELKGLQSFADVNEKTLQVLIANDVNYYESKMTESLSAMKRAMISSVVAGQTEKITLGILEKAGMTPEQAASLLDDSLKKFSRTVFSKMSESLPAKTLYVWSGPVDDRTSAECLDLIAKSPMTKEEFGDAFINGTHFGCRHEPQRFTTKKQLKVKDAIKQSSRA